MKITQDVRDYVERQEAGMAEMAHKFYDMGSDVYIDADKAKSAPHTTVIDSEAAHIAKRAAGEGEQQGVVS